MSLKVQNKSQLTFSEGLRRLRNSGSKIRSCDLNFQLKNTNRSDSVSTGNNILNISLNANILVGCVSLSCQITNVDHSLIPTGRPLLSSIRISEFKFKK